MAFRLQGQLAVADGPVYPVMNIKGILALVPYPGMAHVGFVRQDQGGGNVAYRLGGALVVVADGTDHFRALLRVHPHLIQQPEGHNGPALGVLLPVDDVADVVEISGDLRQLRLPLALAQGQQDPLRLRSHPPHMGKAVFRIAQGA